MKLSILVLSLLVVVYAEYTFATTSDDLSSSEVRLENKSPNAIPFKEKSLLTGSYLTKVFSGFVIAILVGVGILLILRRYYYGSREGKVKNRNIFIEEIRRITPKTTLILVRVRDKRYTISQCGDNIEIMDVENNPTEKNNVC